MENLGQISAEIDIVLGAAACAVVPGFLALAAGASAVVPPRGSTAYVAEGDGRVIDFTESSQGETETLVEVTGLTRNLLGQSAFDKMKAHCLISFSVVRSESSAVGACSETDGDGDILYASFDGEAGKLLGGSSKYAGMTGSAIVSLPPQPSFAPNRTAYSIKYDVAWAPR